MAVDPTPPRPGPEPEPEPERVPIPEEWRDEVLGPDGKPLPYGAPI